MPALPTTTPDAMGELIDLIPQMSLLPGESDVTLKDLRDALILDLAPAGIVVPMIRTPEEAREAVEACRYPPEGQRGFGPMRNMFGMESMQEYFDVAAKQIMVFVQVEHIDAVHNLDAILATPGLDDTDYFFEGAKAAVDGAHALDDRGRA